MIEICQGSPGSGKSAAAVARAIQHLKKGGVVAANFSLVDGWSDTIASKSIINKFYPDRLHQQSLSLYKRFYNVKSIDAIRAINPRSEAVGLHKDNGKYSEGSGLLILDEAQLIFNSRKWKENDSNMGWIEFFTQHRKLGWNVILIAHSIDMIDSQIRPLAEYESRFRNIQKLKIPIIGLPYSPIPLFLVITRYAGLGAGASVVASRDLYPLPLWAAKLYDSLEVFSQDKWNTGLIPTLCGKEPVPFHGTGSQYMPDTVRLSTLSPQCLWSAYSGFDVIFDLEAKDIVSNWPMSLTHR